MESKPGTEFNMQMIPRWKPTLVREKLGGNDLYVYDPAGGQVFQVDGLAALVCGRIDGKKTVRQIADELIAEKQLPVERFLADVEKLIQELQRQALIDFPSPS